MFKQTLVLAVCGILVTACTTTSTPDPRFPVTPEPVIPAQVVLSTQKVLNLEDTMWQLVALTRGVNANQIQDGAFLNFQSVNSRIKGSTGCNRLMGGLKLKANLSNCTKIFCPVD